MLFLSKGIFMSDTDDLKELYCLVSKSKLSAEEKRVADDLLAKMRERLKRERKEKQYIHIPREVIQSVKSRNALP